MKKHLLLILLFFITNCFIMLTYNTSNFNTDYKSVTPTNDICGHYIDTRTMNQKGNLLPAGLIKVSNGKIELTRGRGIIVNKGEYLLGLKLVYPNQFENSSTVSSQYGHIKAISTVDEVSYEYHLNEKTCIPKDYYKYASTEELSMYLDSDESIYLSFSFPQEVLIQELEFVFDGSFSNGIISSVQLSIKTGSSFDVWYPYSGLTCFPTPQFFNGIEVNTQVEYGIDITSIFDKIVVYDSLINSKVPHIVVEDEISKYPHSLNTPLRYKFEAIMANGVTKYMSFNVTIVDSVPPVITQIKPLQFSISDTIAEEEMLEYFIFSDNYLDKISKVEIAQFELLEEYAPGIYEVRIIAKDISDNYSTLDTTIEIIDDVAPLLYGFDEINVPLGYDLNIEDLINKFCYGIDEGEKVKVSITSDNYSSNKDRIGTYSITLKVSDNYNNETYKDVILNVNLNNSPVYYVQDNIITTYSNYKLDAPTILSSLIRTKYLSEDESYLKAEIVEGKYLEKYDVAGDYNITMRVALESGKTQDIGLTIKVLESGKPKKETVFSKIKAFVKRLVDMIIDFFKNLFSWI